MPANNFWKAACIAAAIIFLTGAGNVKDLSTLQSAVSYARDNVDKARTAHQADVQEVERQQQLVADKKKELEEQNRQLDEAKKAADRSSQQYLLSREKYEKAQSALDAALNRK